ncbi:hypothetical protein SAMN05421636_10557 [Pricia antarctica]|uniref:AAA domain-containing protein n=2 Tax=Pricia antarctica TaxID=641691 RepID=A0A1G7CW60_9FLAO|nr:hypothetical protein SAMN05421636_10557 [Pricia antarctica]
MNIMVFGLPGSGKSYFAERLAEKIDAEYVSSDRLRKELFPSRTYSDHEKAAVYDTMLKKLEETNTKKENLVFDATFYKKETRELFIKKAKNNSRFIEVWADEPVIKARLKESRPYSDADFEVHKLIKQEWEPLERPHLRLESRNDNIDVMLQKAMEYLKNEKKSN